MKKFNWKAILIVLMAFILVFALVACDSKKKSEDDNDNKKDGVNEAAEFECPMEDFMTPFLAMTDNIGNEKIEDEKYIYLSADLGVKLGTRTYDKRQGEQLPNNPNRREQVIVGFKNEQSIEIGVKLEAILDRKTADSNGTVLKLKLYSGEVEIAGLYYALAQPKNFYIDFGGQHILFPLSVNFELDGTTYSNSSLGGKLLEALKKQIVIEKNDKTKVTFTIEQMLNAFIGGMGEKWTLDTLATNLIDGVLPGFGLDLNDLLDKVRPFLGDLTDEITDENGKLSIKNTLSNPKICNLLFKKFIKNGNTYSASSDLIMSFISQYIVGSSMTPHLELSFNKEGDAVKDGLTVSIDVEAANYFITEHPFVAIQIKDLEVGDGATHKTAMAINPEDYSSDVQLEVKETLNVSGATLNGVPIDKQVELGAKVKLDFATEEIDQNKTQANIYVQYGDDKVLDVSYVQGRLAFVVNQEPTLGTYPIADKVVELLGGTIYNLLDSKVFTSSSQKEGLHKFADLFFVDGWQGAHKSIRSDFEGAVWTNIDPNVVLDSAVQKLVDLIKEKAAKGKQADAQSAAINAKFQSTSIVDLMYILHTDAKPVLEDGKVSFTVGNSLQFVSKFVNKMFSLPIINKKGETEEKAWTVDGCKTQIKDMIINKIAANDHPEVENNQFSKEQIAAATNEFDKTLEELFTGNTSGKAHLALAGVDFTKKGTASYIDYLLSSVLDNLSANVTIDCTQGLDWTVQASFAGVTITYKSEIRVNGKPATQEDLAKDVTSDTADWYVD